jgi:hypothetical protein
MSNKKRTRMHAGMQIDWVGHADGQGVGVRQGPGKAPAGGGGYLYECTTPQLWEEAKFRELADMGLPAIWLAVARDLGYDRFLAMWRRLDAAVELRSESDSMIEIQMRRYSSFQRYQRNRFIESLAPFLGNAEIRDRVKVQLGEKLSLNHVRRLANRARVGAE